MELPYKIKEKFEFFGIKVSDFKQKFQKHLVK